jgi:hypothetical protein
MVSSSFNLNGPPIRAQATQYGDLFQRGKDQPSGWRPYSVAYSPQVGDNPAVNMDKAGHLLIDRFLHIYEYVDRYPLLKFFFHSCHSLSPFG